MRATRSDDTVLDGAFVPDSHIVRVVPAGLAGADFFILSIFAWALGGFGNIYYGLARRMLELTIEQELVVSGRGEELTRLFRNLLENALDYSPAGSPVTVSVDRIGRELVIAIENEGPPITPELAETIFLPFQRGASAGSGGGFGLGLGIARAIARAHEGELVVDTRAARPRFVVTLRVIDAEGDANDLSLRGELSLGKDRIRLEELVLARRAQVLEISSLRARLNEEPAAVTGSAKLALDGSAPASAQLAWDEFRLPDAPAPLVPTAQVVWRRTGAPGAPTGLGLQFLALDGPSAEMIEAFVDEHLPAAPESALAYAVGEAR